MKTNRNAMSETFKATGARVVWGMRFADVCEVTAEAVANDGASSVATNTIYIEQKDVFCYVELRMTGRTERMHANGVYGTKGRMRFVGSDDSHEWLDVVVVSATSVVQSERLARMV